MKKLFTPASVIIFTEIKMSIYVNESRSTYVHQTSNSNNKNNEIK